MRRRRAGPQCNPAAGRLPKPCAAPAKKATAERRGLELAWKRVDDVQSSLPAKDRARVEREGNLLSRAEYEKYLGNVASRET